MTGFGSASLDNEKISVTVDVKTLNSKFTDTYCRMPKTYLHREVELRNLLSKELVRGKIELNLQITPKDETAAGTSVNKAVIKAYIKDLLQTAKEMNQEVDFGRVLQIASTMPNAFETSHLSDEEEEKEWAFILKVIHEAIQKCHAFRKQEGLITAEKFKEYIEAIDNGLQKVVERDPARIPIIRERIEKSLGDWMNSDSFDANRFEQELIYYVEKFDISEEKVRLKNHLTFFLEELKKEANGKRLNFIAQEIGREINTIGSKANDAEIQRLVVAMKDELEKIKEQTMNIV